MTAGLISTPATVRRLTVADAASYRDLRLEGLRTQPEAFGASWEAEAAQPLAWFADRLRRNVVFGGVPAGGASVDGVAGYMIPDGARQLRTAVLWGMFVRPGARGTGLGRGLLARVLDDAAAQVEEVLLSVVTTNAAAIRLYARAGFRVYGRENRALQLGDQYHDALLMAVALPRRGPE